MFYSKTGKISICCIMLDLSPCPSGSPGSRILNCYRPKLSLLGGLQYFQKNISGKNWPIIAFSRSRQKKFWPNFQKMEEIWRKSVDRLSTTLYSYRLRNVAGDCAPGAHICLVFWDRVSDPMG